MKIAVIPARGGSKRIPRKNIKPFCGKPMIAWSIEAALKSSCFDQVIVSTDDQEIAQVAISYGAQTPFVRPGEFADDYTPTSEVVKHAIGWLTKNNLHPLSVCCIYATAPFINESDIYDSLQIFYKNNCEYVLPITSFPFPIQRAIRITSNRELRMMQPEFFATRSQDLEDAYHDAGQFCWGTTEAWMESKRPFEAKTLPFILPRHKVQDIDTEEDWLRAELMFKAIYGAV